MTQVAVIIPAHNAAATVGRAVRAALAEPEAIEVIVVDDASVDETATTAHAADDGSGRLKILTEPRNAGPSAARNRAIRESVAPWIAVLDADDFFRPGRLKNLLAYADKADLIADDAGRVDVAGIEGPCQSLLGETLAAPRAVSFAEFVTSNVTDRKRPRGEMGFLKPLMRRGFLAAHSLNYREDLRLGEDYELYARALAQGARFLLAPGQGYVSVMRADSLSGNHTPEDLRRLRDCDAALTRMPGLTDADKAALRRHYLSVDGRLQWRLLIEAVKARDPYAAALAFLRPYPVPFYVLARLAEQMILRGAKKLKGQSR
ncbi:MAG TPA: glycosyltransferase family 2 protein [Alphaproteobacteria bacterium]|nr:glycosyltransferase family 2 protein [Alphaproteobacteria bacterium]